MMKLTKVENFHEGDIITMIERQPMYDIKTDSFKTVTFTHKFEIMRNNPKTYSCRYIEGAYKYSGFNWIKGYDLTKSENREYFI